MMELSTPSSKLKGLNAFFFGALAFFTFNTWFLFYNFDKFSHQQDWVQHTFKVMLEVDQIISGVKDAESSVRGYYLSGSDDHLVSFRDGVNEAWLHLNQVKLLTIDNPAQQMSISILEDQLKKRLVLLNDGIDKYQRVLKSGKKPELDVAIGKASMDLLKNQVDVMKANEKRLLEERISSVKSNELYFYLALLSTALLTLLLVSYAFSMFRKNYLSTLEETKIKTHEAWKNSRIAEMSQMLAEQRSVDVISEKVLSFIGETTHVPAGSLYVKEEGRLRRSATYASMALTFIEGENQIPEFLSLDRGLLGEAFRAVAPVQIRAVPADYVPISSSLGSSQPRFLLFLPISFQKKNIAIIELACFEDPTENMLDFLKDLSDAIGIGISSAQFRERQQGLLEKTQQQAEELQAQQEELRVNNEELEEQTRALESQQHTLEQRNQQLEQTRRDVEMKASDLEKASQYKSEFLAKMSHELRTPLNSLLILSSLLFENKEGNLTDQQRTFAKSIQDSGNDLLNLINDILDLSKIEARKLSLRIETFNLSSVLSHLRSTFEPQATEKKLKLTTLQESYPADFKMTSDRMRLEQILRNFVSNALKFTESGEVKLEARPATDPAYIQFIVTDTGIGIPLEKRDLIFNAFEQADGSISRRFGGTGLGLTISRELAQLFGGSIRVESEPGQGSKFILEVPTQLQQAPLENLPPARIPDIHTQQKTDVESFAPNLRLAENVLKDVSTGEKTILIVEDDDAFRISVAEAARSYGFRALEAGDGEVALEILKRHSPSAILLDVKLPGLSGMGLLESIKNIPHLRHIPVHIISGLDYQHNALKMGAIGYLAKPVNIGEVRSVLARIETMISQKVKKLLIVEDDQRQQEALKHLVSGPDLEIHLAKTGQNAFEMIQKQTFDCIILDLSLPDVTGIELLDRLNSVSISLPPVVIYTGKELSPHEEEKLRHYSDSIIIKGAKSPDRLLDEVNLFLHRVESLLPDEKKHMLLEMRTKEKVFDGKTALLVDDDLRNVFALTSALEGKGFAVRVARNGIEALDALKEFSDIDIILMDLMMPKMDGLECMRHIRKMDFYDKTPIIALTAKAMKGDYEKCIEAGANDYLPKPINLINLISVMKVWLNPPGLFL